MKKIHSLLAFLLIGTALLWATGCSDDDNSGKKVDGPTSVVKIDNVGSEGIALGKEGSTTTVNVSFQPANDQYYYRLSSTDERIFTVSQNGVLTAVARGEAYLEVVVRNNTNASTKYKVTVAGTPVTSVVLAPSIQRVQMTRDGGNPSLDVSQSVSVLPVDASIKAVKYTSLNPEIATVNDLGVIVGRSTGKTSIRVSSTDGTEVYSDIIVAVGGYTYTPLARTAWTLESSPIKAYPAWGAGELTNLIDDPTLDTSVAIQKIGNTDVPSTGAFFTIDMKTAGSFSYFQLTHRTGAANGYGGYVLVASLNMYGSNDNSTFTQIQNFTGLATYGYGGSGIEARRLTTASPSYRYIKCVITPTYSNYPSYDLTYMIIKDFQVGSYVYTDPATL